MYLVNFLKKLFSKDSTTANTNTNQKAEGIVKYFNRKRGFGFISSKQTKQDVFLHISNLEGRVWSGAKVAFHVEQNEKGLIAKNIEIVGK